MDVDGNNSELATTNELAKVRSRLETRVTSMKIHHDRILIPSSDRRTDLKAWGSAFGVRPPLSSLPLVKRCFFGRLFSISTLPADTAGRSPPRRACQWPPPPPPLSPHPVSLPLFQLVSAGDAPRRAPPQAASRRAPGGCAASSSPAEGTELSPERTTLASSTA